MLMWQTWKLAVEYKAVIQEIFTSTVTSSLRFSACVSQGTLVLSTFGEEQCSLPGAICVQFCFYRARVFLLPTYTKAKKFILIEQDIAASYYYLRKVEKQSVWCLKLGNLFIKLITETSVSPHPNPFCLCRSNTYQCTAFSHSGNHLKITNVHGSNSIAARRQKYQVFG